MNERIKTVELKTGESMDILRVTCPDAEYKDRILPFLGHKGDPWEVPMRLNLEAELEGLGQHFYIGVVGEEIVGNASSIEALDRPVGILQHVFTPEARRRQGICSAIIHAYAADFDARGGRAAYLHTGYDSAAYHIYASAGFVGYLDTGTMERFLDPAFEADFWAPRPVTARDTQWQDWALLEALYGVVDGWRLRSFHFGQWGRCGYEGEYVYLRKELGEGRLQQPKVLEAGNGAVVGHAYLSRGGLLRREGWMLDFFLHPDYYDQASVLLDSLDLNAVERVWCLADAAQPEKGEMLKRRGLKLEATLPRQAKIGEEWVDVRVYGG